MRAIGPIGAMSREAPGAPSRRSARNHEAAPVRRAGGGSRMMIAALFVERGGDLGRRLAARLELRASGCWIWTGSTNEKGYGQISVSQSKPKFVHRVAWTIARGLIPPGICVLHHCDVPACCNPDHLFLGTRADNNADMRAKGRARYVLPPPAHNGSAKLRPDEIAQIRASHERGPILAARFHVSRSTISLVRRRDIWKDIP